MANNVQDQINRIKQKVLDAYTVAGLRGAPLPSALEIDSLPDTIDAIPAYEHPEYTEHAKGFYKIANDDIGSITEAEAVTKADITALGIPAQDTTYEAATASADGLMAKEDKSKLDAITAGANKVSFSYANDTLTITLA